MTRLSGPERVIARDELEQALVPWFGRRYEPWLRHQVQLDPIDPLVVRIPDDLYEEYRRRPKMTPLTSEQKRRLGVR